MNPETEPRTSRLVTPALVVGIAIIVFGLFLTLENLGFEYSHMVFKFWPVILVILGLLKLRACQGTCVGGYLLTGAGLVLLLKTLGGHSVDVLIGPLILTGVGIFIVLKALKQHRQVPEELQQSEGFLRGNAIFSAFKNRHQSQTFRGGELTAIFGGFEVDLRQAVIEGSSARLDSFVMFGGGDIRVPEGWEVVVQATALFGGVNDKTAPLPTGTEVRPRLVITGLVLFGGIEIRH
jgi:predicted membrane protein